MPDSTKPPASNPPPAAPTYTTWVRERGVGTSGPWHRPVAWPPLVPGAPVPTACGSEVVVDYSANIGSTGRPHPACPVCAP